MIKSGAIGITSYLLIKKYFINNDFYEELTDHKSPLRIFSPKSKEKKIFLPSWLGFLISSKKIIIPIFKFLSEKIDPTDPETKLKESILDELEALNKSKK